MTKLSDQVYSLLTKIPKGRVTTYKILANKLGTKGYRAVGQILKRNPDAPRIPCHRVIASDGTLGGFMGTKKGISIARKKALLQKEGINFSGKKIVDFTKVVYSFT